MEKQEVHALGVVQRDVEESQEERVALAVVVLTSEMEHVGVWLACSEFLFAWFQCWVAANLLFLVLDGKPGLNFTVLV